MKYLRPIYTAFGLALITATLSCGSVQAPKPTPASQKTVTIFAAASLKESFDEIGALFEKTHGAKVAINFGASNELRTQLENGAKGDVFASANTKEMDAAVKANVVTAETAKTFARNRLVVIVPKTNPAGLAAPKDLAKPGTKLVLAGENVPAGKYALEMIEKLAADPANGDDFKAKAIANVVSREQNVKAVVAKIRAGAGDAGVCYASDAGGKAADELAVIAVPDAVNPKATYPIAALAKAEDAELAKKFVELVLSPEGQAILVKHGLLPAAP